jgi:hypothetical protein
MANPAANTYAVHLGGRDPFAVMESTPTNLERLYHTLGSDGMNRSYAPGKWTAREILAHLADCEIAFAFRIRQALAEDHHVVQTFDQDKWARNYSAYLAPQAVAAFTALRRWNVDLVSSASPETLAKPFNHPERGELTLKGFVEILAGHDLNHLAQLEMIATQKA